MPALDDILRPRLQLLENKQLRRTLTACEPLEGVRLRRGDKTLISFSGNDYLGLSRHPKVIAAAKEALEQYGAGGQASRLVTGNHPLYARLEAQLAAMKSTEAACVFGSGYMANIGTVPALVGKADMILADKLSHACMLDGAQLSGADLYRFAHNNVAHARELLARHRADYAHCLIMTETIFSMDGDRAPLAELAALAEEYDGWLMTDDAHGLGIGDRGLGIQGKAHIQMGTLSKAAGSYGGYVCASKTVIDYLATTARSLIYSTALPPATLAASLAALEVMQADAALCARPLALARLFTQNMGLPEAQSAIVPLIVGDSAKALELSQRLEEHGFLVHAIRPPTVPPDTARLRFAFSALHEEADIARLVESISACKDLIPA